MILQLPNLAALNTPMSALGSFPLVKSGQLVQSAPDTNAELNLWKNCINESAGNRVKQEPGERQTSRTDSEQTRPGLRAIPSEESSQMMADENLWLMQDLGMPSLDEHKVEKKTGTAQNLTPNTIHPQSLAYFALIETSFLTLHQDLLVMN